MNSPQGPPGENSERIRHLRVYGRVGANLPDFRTLSLGDLTIAKWPPGLKLMLPPSRIRAASALPTVLVQAQEIDVDTDIIYWTDKRNMTVDEALDSTQTDQDPVVRAVLSEAVGFSVTTDLITCVNLDTGQMIATGKVSTATYLAPTPAERDRITALGRQLQTDKHLLQACRHLYAGMVHAEHRGSAGLVATESAIVEYTKCIELLARDRRFQRATSPSNNQADDQERREAIALLRTSLSKGSVASHVRAVRTAATTLRDLESPSLRTAFERFASRVGLEESWLDAAQHLVGLRNSIAHAGSGVGEKARHFIVSDGTNEWEAFSVAIRAVSAAAATLAGTQLRPRAVPPDGVGPPAALRYEVGPRVVQGGTRSAP